MEEKLQPPKSKRRARLGLIALGWLVSLIALFYGISDWRGARAWNNYRSEYEDRVAPLNLQAYTPKEIPDSENFGATPFARAWFTQRNDPNFLYNRDTWAEAARLVADSPKHPPGRPSERHFQDLVAWQEAFTAVRSGTFDKNAKFCTDKLDLASRAQAAPAVLDGTKEDEDVFKELRAASARPGIRYAVEYDMDNPWGILLPHLARIKQTCRRVALKACAELALGQSGSALDDIKLALYLEDSSKSEPFLISYLVRVACLQITVEPIWEGLAEHRWNDDQLQQLQARLEAYDFLTDMQRPMNAERAAGVLTADLLKRKGAGLLADIEDDMNGVPGSRPAMPDKGVLNFVGHFVPAGWYDQEKLHYCQGFDQLLKGVIDEPSKRIFPRQLAAQKSGPWPIFDAVFHHHIIEAMMLPALHGIPIKAAGAQTVVDQAATACALERFRMANGQYPENLQALVPRFLAHLPNDVFTGEPFNYRRTDDGRFVLTSAGGSQTDNGGAPGGNIFDKFPGDWVWEYPSEK